MVVTACVSSDQYVQAPDVFPGGNGQAVEVFAGTVAGHHVFFPVVAPAAGGVVGAGTGGIVIELSMSPEQSHVGLLLGLGFGLG